MDIRPYTPQDLKQAANLVAKAYACPPWSEEWTQEQGENSILSFVNNPLGSGYVGEVDGEMVAVLIGHMECYRDMQYFTNHLCVLPQHQGKGYGGALLRHLTEDMRLRGVPHLELMTQPDGMPFYERCGYRQNPHLSMYLDL